MFHLVSTDGKYHGEVESAEAAKQLESVQKSKAPGYFRLIDNGIWESSKNLPMNERAAVWTEKGVTA